MSHAIVTGGSSGIGLAVACRLASHDGVTVSIIGRDIGRLGAAVRHVAHVANSMPVTAVADVADRDAVDTAVARLTAEHGPCSILVTSAGYAHPGLLTDMAGEDIERQIAVNLLGTINAVRAVASDMKARRNGSIIMVSSAAAFVPLYGLAAYSASKCAVAGLARAFGQEMRPHGVHVGCVFNPDTDTPGFARENLTKLRETQAISGGIAPIHADDVAAAIEAGIARRKTRIIPDARTRGIAELASPSLTERLIDRHVDRAVARIARERDQPVTTTDPARALPRSHR